MPLRVFVSVGTDHHPFDRLSQWVDIAMGRHPALIVRMQSGTSVMPQHAHAQDYLAYDEMRKEMINADVVVCHGGPATIVEARSAGHRPVVVPRRHGLGEHVDDHQVRFARWMAAREQVVLADDVEQFVDILTAVWTGTRSLRRTATDDREPVGVRRVAELLGALLGDRVPVQPSIRGNATPGRMASPTFVNRRPRATRS